MSALIMKENTVNTVSWDEFKTMISDHISFSNINNILIQDAGSNTLEVGF